MWWQDQVNNADSAIIFLINHWSVRIVKVVWSVRVVEVVQDVQIVHVVHWSKWSKWSRWYGRKVESSAVFCLSRIRKKSLIVFEKAWDFVQQKGINLIFFCRVWWWFTSPIVWSTSLDLISPIFKFWSFICILNHSESYTDPSIPHLNHGQRN